MSEWGRIGGIYSHLPLSLDKTHKSHTQTDTHMHARTHAHTHKCCYVMRRWGPVSGPEASSLALNVRGKKGGGGETEEEGRE